MIAPTTPAPVAAIDIGTNSLHLVIARPRPDGGFEVITREKETVRLGSGAGDLDTLAPDAIDRGIAALTRFGKLADRHGARVVAVATSAVREAANRNEFLRRAREEAGVDVDVISGVEEARLIELGVLQAVPVFEQRHLVIDIGGGSTEVIIGEAGRTLLVRSLKLGHIRLTDRFFPTGKSGRRAVGSCRDHLRSFLRPVAADVVASGFETAAGSSGTIVTVATMAASAAGLDVRTPNNLVLSRAALDDVVATLLACRTTDARARLPGVDTDRAATIVGGALLLEQLFEAFGMAELVVSDHALREGVLLDRSRPETDGFHHLSDIRRDSVLRMAELFEEDREHVEHATDLALELFDDLADLHGYGFWERDLLEAAGLLHNVGLFVSHAAHHKHSYYLIRNSDRLVGFTDREIELIAQVARYHRRSAPRPRHQEFAALDTGDQQRVRLLAGTLRLAIALDRSGDQRCRRARARLADDRAVVVEAEVDPGTDVSLEMYAAADRSRALAEALDRTVEVRGVEVAPRHPSRSAEPRP